MKFKKIFNKAIDNWPAKILSFAFAIILVQFYKSSLLEKRYFSVPLVLENNGYLVPASNIPRIVKVSVWGNTLDLAPIKEDDIIAFVDISSIKTEGEYSIPIKTKIKGTTEDSDSIEIGVHPGELKIKLEKGLSKIVPIKLSLQGTPLENYEVYQSEIHPESVEISGPYSEVSKIEELFTNPVSIDNRKSSFTGYVDIFNANTMISLGSSQFSYSVMIRGEVQIKEYKDLPLFFENLSNEFEIVSESPKGMISVRGSKIILEDWKPPRNVLRVQCEDISKEGTYNLPVQAIIPGKFERIDANPQNVKIEVKKKQDIDNDSKNKKSGKKKSGNGN